MESDPNQKLTLNEVAAEIRRSVITLRRWIKDGVRGIRLRAIVLGGSWIIRRGDLDAFIEQVTRLRISDPVPPQESQRERERNAKAAQERLRKRVGTLNW